MGEIKSYKDLIVWQKSHKLCNRAIDLVEKFKYGKASNIISEQLIRSATSIPANIAEGYGRHKGKEFQNYLYIAKGSALETDYWLFLCSERNLIDKNEYSELAKICNEIILMLFSIIRKL